MVLDGYGVLLMVIECYIWLSSVIYGCGWLLSVIILYGYPWLLSVIYGCGCVIYYVLCKVM